MTIQSDHARTLHALHKKGDPVVLFNVWDAGSARSVADAGARAIATGSAPVAMANGYGDGEKIPLDLALENVRRIVDAVELPVSMDIEGAYGVAANDVGETVARVIDAGAVGFNFEDQVVGGTGLHDTGLQSERIAAARQACSGAGVDAFINARTDIFLKAKPDTHTDGMLEDAIQRGLAYGQAGANGFFAPGLVDENLIGRLCGEVSLPVNIIALPGAPANARLAELGVARISYGPVPYRRMIQWLTEEARQALSSV